MLFGIVYFAVSSTWTVSENKYINT